MKKISQRSLLLIWKTEHEETQLNINIQKKRAMKVKWKEDRTTWQNEKSIGTPISTSECYNTEEQNKSTRTWRELINR